MAYIQESNLVPLGRPLIPGERVIRIGNTLVPASVIAAEKVQPPVKGLVFYHSFDGTDTAKTDVPGGTISVPYGTVTYTEEDDIPCAYFSSAGMLVPKISEINAATAFTLSVWFKGTNNTTNAPIWWACAGTSGDAGSGFVFSFDVTTSKFNVSSGGTYDFWTTDTYDMTQWHFLCFVSDGTNFSFYVDGTLQNSGQLWNLRPDSRSGGFGKINQYNAALTCYLAAARTYRRALSDAELASLASEFNP